MNNVSEEKQKNAIMKSLAIAGFISIIIIIAWLSVKLVHVVPGAFSSLASLAESVNQSGETTESTTETELQKFTVTSNTNIVNADGSIDLAWETTNTPGSYTFSYDCKDGVAIDLIGVEGITSIACATNYNLGNTESLSLTVRSEKDRYADVRYTVAFLGTNDTTPRATAQGSFTIINSSINDLLATSETDTAVAEMNDPESETATNTAEPFETEHVASGETSAGTTPAPQPQYEQEYIYAIPSSDPNGRTDLSTRFISTGKIVGNTFFPGAVESKEAGAIQFEVKNLGTKTSGSWDFTVTLPDGSTFESDAQKALKPNERAVLTIGFPEAIGNSHNFRVTVDETTDRNPLNDTFTQTVRFAG